MHLHSRCQHDYDCTERECARKCGLRQFDEWLDAPLMPWEQREHVRTQQRLAELLAGRIPGAVPTLAEPAGEGIPSTGDAMQHTS